MKEKINKVCVSCNLEFLAYRIDTKLCNECKISKLRHKICANCNLEFTTSYIHKKFCDECKKQIAVICEVCKKIKHRPKHDKARFCSQSCRNKWQHANGRRKIGFDPTKPWLERVREQFDDEVAEQRLQEYKQKMSVAILASDMTLMKQVNSKKRGELNKLQKGKTYEEIYGEEKAAQIKAKLSQKLSGELNPAYGKVYANGGKSVKGYYKGLFFRSLFEYSFMKHLENKGFVLNTDVKCESHRFMYELNGNKRTYCPDFFVIPENVLYEVKPYYALNTEINQCKFQAARCALEGTEITFCVVSEKDFQKISFDEACKDIDIVWKEKTFEFFKRNHD